MYRGRIRTSTGGGGMLFILAFHALAQYAGRDQKPPVTAAVIVANVLLFLRPGRLDDILPSISEVCLNPHLVFKNWDVKRIFLSAFYHADETHLVYNMLSLLWKGVQLEGSMGSAKFAEMVAVLLGLSHSLVVVVAKGLNVLGEYPDVLHNHCAIGFSAVLFALKVVLNRNSPTFTNVYGVLVPSRYAAWAELVLIQMFVPGTSFLGHLCGILAGLLYVHYSRWLTASGFFGALMRSWSNFRRSFIWQFPLFRRGRSFNDPRHGEGRRARRDDSTFTPDETSSVVWQCHMCTFDNSIYVDNCEMCGAAFADRPGSSIPSAPPLPSGSMSVDEMRRARLARFNR
ncbi:hypothetical protein L7F22_027190 [Adiantum nelumboides]|nr:hypothetical protein [Adiantum nelumboides]